MAKAQGCVLNRHLQAKGRNRSLARVQEVEIGAFRAGLRDSQGRVGSTTRGGRAVSSVGLLQPRQPVHRAGQSGEEKAACRMLGEGDV